MDKVIINDGNQGVIEEAIQELETSLDAMRVYCDVMAGQLFEHVASDKDSSLALQERMQVLVRSLRREITHSQELHSELLTLRFARC